MATTIKTASDLRMFYEENNPDGHFFDRQTMKCFGDTMRNYGICRVTVRHKDTGEEIQAIELYRRRPVRHGRQGSRYFDEFGRELARVERIPG